MLEGPRSSALAIDETKLKFLNSKVSIWDRFTISGKSYKSSSIEEETSMLNRQVSELYQKYYDSGNFIWPEHGYFNQQPCEFYLNKENYPENSIFKLIKVIFPIRIIKNYTILTTIFWDRCLSV